MTDNFFENKETVEPEITETQETPSIKVGEKEYTPEQLDRLVSLGEKGAELEDKWNTKIDTLYPSFTRETQKRKELEERILELEAAQQSAGAQNELTEEQMAERARQELEKLGGITEKNVNKYILNVIQARDMVQGVKDMLETAKEEGNPSTTVEEFMGFMEERGIRNPEDAYDIMFKKELKEIESKKLETIKTQPFVTTEGSTAGSKIPERKPITSDNLSSALSDFFRQREGVK